MPWKVKGVMDQRIEFVARAVSQEKTVSELCHTYGISRTTGHRWIRRYREVGSFVGLWENPNRGLPQQPACGYDGQAATRLAHTLTGAATTTGRSIQGDSGGMSDNRDTP